MLKKLIFKDEVKEILLEQIQRGTLKPGSRISLPNVAEKLEVSVTPIREALTQLSETGIVNYIPNRGFFVMELSTADAKEIYDLMGVLESEALQNAAYGSQQLEELQEINNNFVKATNAREMLEFDRMFHEKLIENYSNNYARGIIDQLRVRISLYDYAFWNETQKKESIEIHENIIAYLKNDDITSAVKILKHNWSIGIPFIIENFEK